MRLLRLKTVLAATDLDSESLPALRTARELADASGSVLHVVHASDSPTVLETVGAMARRAGMAPSVASIHIVAGPPAHAITLLADEIQAGVIVMGPHRARQDVKRSRALGSTALSLVTNASVPCLVVARPLRLPLERVVVAIDLSDTARGALVVGLSWASALRAHDRDVNQTTTLTALHVFATARPGEGEPAQTFPLEKELQRLRDDAGAWAGVDFEAATTSNADAATGIARYANEHRADLLVLGTRGLGQDAVGRLGSVSLAAMQRAEMPTLLVPPAVWMAYARETS
jgi:nucleotide-binding universal stress UspA family protein